jgi:AcrR family transcriptional regulator
MATRRAIRRQPAVSRGEILDAALACFTERGYHETSIDHIAARAGLSKGAIYWHFEGKRELFLALVDRLAEQALPILDAAAAEPDWRSALHVLFARLRDYLAEGMPMFRLGLEYVSQSGRDDDIRIRAERGHGLWKQAVELLIAKGVADGSLRPMPAAEVALVIDATIDGLMLAKLMRPGLDLDSTWRVAEEIFWRGISA